MKLKLVAAVSALAIPALAHAEQSGSQPAVPKPTKADAFITLVGGAAATWPFAVWAQQPERMKRIGVLAQKSVAGVTATGISDDR